MGDVCHLLLLFSRAWLGRFTCSVLLGIIKLFFHTVLNTVIISARPTSKAPFLARPAIFWAVPGDMEHDGAHILLLRVYGVTHKPNGTLNFGMVGI
jgi:hypothetical protein